MPRQEYFAWRRKHRCPEQHTITRSLWLGHQKDQWAASCSDNAKQWATARHCLSFGRESESKVVIVGWIAKNVHGSQVELDWLYLYSYSDLTDQDLARKYSRPAPSVEPCREVPWAMCGRLRVGKDFIHECSIGRCRHAPHYVLFALPTVRFEDEVEQSLPRSCRQTDGRSKRTYELTSSIVQRRTSFRRWVELEFPPIAFDPARSSCCCDVPGPAELGAVNPDAVPANYRARAVETLKTELKPPENRRSFRHDLF